MADTPCPICRKPSPMLPRLRPFCSLRCAEVDLGRWFGGQYRVPSAPAEEEEGELDPRSGVR